MSRERKNSGIEWIKDIPSDWNVLKGKYILQLLKRLPKEEDGVITCFRDGEVTLRSNRREEGFTFADKEIGYQGIEKGDLVIHGMDGFAGAIGISDSSGKGSPVLNVCQTKENCNIYFVQYYLRMLASQNVFLALATGIRERSCDLRWNKIADLQFPIPLQEEQTGIANYLDARCTLIDRTIEKQKQVIEKLKKYSQAVITETVIKGLNPNVQMKDSGIEWIGEIPVHWEVVKLKYISKCNQRTLSDKTDKNKEIDYIDIGSVTNDEGIKNIQKFIFSEAPSRARRIVRSGDTIISTVRTYLKAIAFINSGLDNSICSTGFAVITPNINRVLEEYMFCILHADWFVSLVESFSNGISYPAINSSRLIDIKVIIPPKQEQEKIIEELNHINSKVGIVIKDKEKLIEKLEAYKKSLIYECVTGKREVK